MRWTFNSLPPSKSLNEEEENSVNGELEAEILKAYPLLETQLRPQQPSDVIRQLRAMNTYEYTWTRQREEEERNASRFGESSQVVPSGPFRSGQSLDRQIGLLDQTELNAQGWEQHDTPEGLPYFRHKSLPVVTHDYLRHQDTLERTQTWLQMWSDIIHLKRNQASMDYCWPSEWELYLRVEADSSTAPSTGSQDICYYYLLDIAQEEVFWLHSFSSYSEIIPEIEPLISSNTVQLHLRHEFWAHMEVFPREGQESSAEKQLQALLLWAAVCEATTITPVISFDGKAEMFLGLLDKFKEGFGASREKHLTIARLMKVFYATRIRNRYGEYGVRISVDQPVLLLSGQDPPRNRPSSLKYLVYCVLHALVLGGDRGYLQDIRKLLAGGYTDLKMWNRFVVRLVETNNQSTLIVSALFFTGNIGFLGINGLQEDQNMLSIVATLLSLGSLLVGLQQVLHHNGLKQSNPDRRAWYWETVGTTWLGHRAVAIYYAAPSALLVWSALMTVIALLLWCFQVVALDWTGRGLMIAFLLILGGAVQMGVNLSYFLTSVERTDGEARCVLSWVLPGWSSAPE